MDFACSLKVEETSQVLVSETTTQAKTAVALVQPVTVHIIP
jgi:hypothetical protein